MGFRDPVTQVAGDHAQSPGRGQWCVSVDHGRLPSADGLCRNFHPVTGSPFLISSTRSWQEPHAPQHLDRERCSGNHFWRGLLLSCAGSRRHALTCLWSNSLTSRPR